MLRVVRALAALGSAGVLLASASPANSANEPPQTIVLATTNAPDHAVVGQLYKQLLEGRGFKVVYRQVGSSREAHEALASRRVDMYLDYTGQLVKVVFGRAAPRSAPATYVLAKQLAERQGLTVLRPAPSLARERVLVTRSTAARFAVGSIYDLRRIPGLRIGGSSDFAATPLGLARLRRTYRLPRVTFVPLEPPAQLAALAAGKVQAIVTAPSVVPVGGPGAKVLKDPRGLFAAQNLAPVASQALVSRLGVKFVVALDSLSARLSQRTMRTLRRRAPARAAKSFLMSAGLISAGNVFVAPNGSDAGRNCRRFAALVSNPDPTGATLCQSFDRAYHLGAAGDTIEVVGGRYGGQRLTSKPRAASPGVVIRPTPGADVAIDDLVTSGDWVTVRNVTVATGGNHARGWKNTASNVVLDDVDVTGPWANVGITAGSNVTWKNSGLGDPGNTQIRLCQKGDGEPVELSNVRNLVFSNIDFYPFQPEIGNPVCGPDGNMHLETIRVWDGVNGWRMERSRFHNGDGSGSARVFFSKIGGADPTNVTFVNNWFGNSTGSVSVYLTRNSPCTNYTFAYNHWEQAFVDECTPKNSLRVIGNTGTKPNYIPCGGIVYIRNLWSWDAAGTCGTDRWVTDPCKCLAPFRYGPDGYHLLAGSPAINAGDTTQCRVLTRGVDIDGRPRKGVCDAGPDEYGN
jgi:glycine betaine/choline ABC-type transport system substrate-binding protein